MAEKFKLTIVTPDREFYNEDVDMVEFNTTEGEIGIYKGHAPLTVIVSPGILRITQGDQTKSAALHTGFVQILQDEVTILAEVIEWPGEIDEERAKASGWTPCSWTRASAAWTRNRWNRPSGCWPD